MLELKAETDGEWFRIWGTMASFPPSEPFDGGTVSVIGTDRRIPVPRSGRFSVDSLRGNQSLLFEAEGHRPLTRSVARLYSEVRG